MGKRARRWGFLLLALAALIALAALPEMFPDHGMIYRAILKNDVQRARELLDRGADPNSRRAILSELSLSFLKVRTTRSGSGFDFSVQDPLVTIAIQKRSFEIAELLLNRGADPNARDERGYTVLCDAAISDHPGIVTLLLQKGADAKLEMPDGSTALREGPEFQRRIRVAHPEIVAMLKAAGAR